MLTGPERSCSFLKHFCCILSEGDHSGLQNVGGLIVLLLSDLMLQTAVLSLCVLPDDHDVNVLMASLDSWEGLAVHHVGKQV